MHSPGDTLPGQESVPCEARTHAAPEEALGRRLVFTAKRVRHRFEQHLGRSGSRLVTWVVLTHARRTPGCSQSQLAELMGVEGPTMARHLDRLEAAGLVERRRDGPDRRVSRIHLTEAGVARHDELVVVVERFDRRLRATFSPAEQQQLRSFLDRIDDALEAMDAAIDR
jgi:MarR family transcriptional regulator, transcriptional regulator for hemolysin